MLGKRIMREKIIYSGCEKSILPVMPVSECWRVVKW
jgi:hypothetical protein